MWTLLALLPAASGQSPATFDGHIVWERDFDAPTSTLGSAVVDSAGVLWSVSGFTALPVLTRVSPQGKLIGETDCNSGKPSPPSEFGDYRLALSSKGAMEILVSYSRWIGRTVYFDGAKVAAIHSDGTCGEFKPIVGPGAQYLDFSALSNGGFLAAGDQAPFTLIRIDPSGRVAWRRTFSEWWVGPSAAALNGGSVCVAAVVETRPSQPWHEHLMIVAPSGAVIHQRNLAGIAGTQMLPGPNGNCLALSSPNLPHSPGRLTLSSFGGDLSLLWSAPVPVEFTYGGGFMMVSTTKGPVAAARGTRGLFVAAFDFTGKLRWVAQDSERTLGIDQLASAGDSFYVLGGGKKPSKSLHVIRMR